MLSCADQVGYMKYLIKVLTFFLTEIQVYIETIVLLLFI